MSKTYSFNDNRSSSNITAPPNRYIMGGATRQGVKIDTLDLNLYFDLSTLKEGLFKELKDLKNELQMGNNSYGDFQPNKKNRFFSFSLSRTGIKFFPYLLNCGDVTLALSSRCVNDSSMPSARLHIGSLSSQDDVLRVIREITGWLSLFGVKVVKDTVSRVDVCCDMLQDIKDESLLLYDDERFVTCSRWFGFFKECKKVTGVQFGKGDVVLRMYDKIVELNKSSHKEHKKTFFYNMWLGILDTSKHYSKEMMKNSLINDELTVTRVEFQLRKKFLDDFLTHGSFSDFLNNINDIWVYLTRDWIRHSANEIDRENRHQDRVEISAFWEAVSSALWVHAGKTRVKKRHLYKSEKGLREQLQGLLVTLCAGKGYESLNFFGMIGEVQKIAREEILLAMKNVDDFTHRFNVKQNSFILSF